MKDLPKVICIMGPPGAGKGTQASFLAKEINYHQFSTGAAFRTVAKQKTDLGRQVREIMEQGKLCPPELAAQVVIEAIHEQVAAGKGIIFDGTPRTVKEAGIVDGWLKEQGYGRPLVIFLEIDRAHMEERNLKRRYCLDITPDFPIMDETDVERCATLGGRLGRRPDDEPEMFNARWQQYTDLTKPVVDSYEQEGILTRVDGRLSIPDVHAAVMKAVRLHGASEE